MNFAVIENGIVENIIVADSKEIAEEITGYTCISYTDEKPALIGGVYDGVDFIAPQPFPSWNLNSKKIWEAPVAYPKDKKNYQWNEETTSWVEIPQPEEIPVV